MKNELLLEAVIAADEEPVVICNTEHRIVYMNPAAVKRYEKRGGEALIGQSIFDCHNARSTEMILSIFEKFRANPEVNKVYTFTQKKNGEDADIYMVALRNGNGELIGYYEKHESRIHEEFR